MKKLKKRMEAKKMGLFERSKNRKTQEELNEEFSKLGEETEVIDIEKPKKSIPPMAQKKAIKPVPKEDTSDMEMEEYDVPEASKQGQIPLNLKAHIEAFNKDYSFVQEQDKKVNLLFAIYCEQRKNNRLTAQLVVLMEEMRNG
jgi:hypothetical protein